MTTLAQYDVARAALAEATRIDEMLPLLEEVEHVKLYARQIQDRELLAEATEFQMRAERRLGTVICAAKEAGHFIQGKRSKKSSTEVSSEPPRATLEEAGVSHKLSVKAQKASSISEQAFDAMVAAKREQIRAGKAVTVDAEPINGARSVMGSRQEPPDSLDYFPTPPFVTRALVEEVLPQLGIAEIKSAWEPACGEGHIAGVLTEYGTHVYATDIFDYGTKFQDRLCDFLNPADYAPSVKPGRHDWIITNPPFGDKAIEFVLRGLEMAKVGVAMFFRSQWAVEGKERYERLFRDRPPTLCAFFVERVNLRKGHWDAKGSTATAYCWLVWLQGPENPRAPFWIPPGRKKALSRPEDRERFAPSIVEEPPHDETTGEIINEAAE